ncbi:MAG: hypothetical protein QXI84_05150 [Thermofilaceae archaeon]
MKLGGYLKRYPKLERVVLAAVECLPGGRELLEVEVSFVNVEGAEGYADLEGRRVVLANDPPDAETVLRELAHIASEDELEATVLSLILLYCAERGVRCNVLKLRGLRLADVKAAVREVGGMKSLEELLKAIGIYDLVLADLEVSEKLAVKDILGWLAVWAEWDEASRRILDRLLELCAEH